jgi:hypothetical protein
MQGLAPTFYKITLTPALAPAVQRSEYPHEQDETLVQRVTPSRSQPSHIYG